MTEPTSRASVLIAELSSVGQPVDAGAFTLDASQAAEKFAKFRYRDRQLYLLHIVEGLRALGCGRIEVDSRAGDISVHGDLEEPIAEAEERLHGIYAERFDTSPTPLTRGLARIAVGIDMALGTDVFRRIVVESLAPTGRQVAVYAAGTAPQVWSAPAGRAARSAPGLHILFDRGVGDAIAAAALKASPAVDHLRDAVSASPLPIAIDGIACHSRRTLRYRRERTGDGWRLVYGVDVPRRERPGEAVFTSNGIAIEREPVDLLDFFAEVELHDVRRDLAEAHVLEHPGREQARAALREAIEEVRDHKAKRSGLPMGPRVAGGMAPAPKWFGYVVTALVVSFVGIVYYLIESSAG